MGDDIATSKLSKILNNYKIYSFKFIESKNRIEQYCNIINSDIEGDFIFLGYSSSGQLAFEVAKFLKSKKLKKIILLDSVKTIELNSIKGKEKEILLKASKDFGMSKSQIESFMDMINTTINKGVVDVDIDMLRSEEKIEDIYQNWSLNTSKKYRVYQGFGNHIEMVSDMYLGKNCDILKKILD